MDDEQKITLELTPEWIHALVDITVGMQLAQVSMRGRTPARNLRGILGQFIPDFWVKIVTEHPDAEVKELVGALRSEIIRMTQFFIDTMMSEMLEEGMPEKSLIIRTPPLGGLN